MQHDQTYVPEHVVLMLECECATKHMIDDAQQTYVREFIIHVLAHKYATKHMHVNM